MARPEVPLETKQAQASASDPAASAWVSANAGSGKTHVLAQRVMRLLLQGTNPARVLCLTFTKAAAGEMANRVFDNLGKWTQLDDDALAAEIAAIEGAPPKKATLDFARTLFARALETPGGLKIQTIHAFCEALLHQFPLEANVPGNFNVMDDAAQKLLMEQARRDIVLSGETGLDEAIASAFDRMMGYASDHQIEKILKQLVTRRDEILAWLTAAGGPEAATKNTMSALGFAEQDSSDDLLDDLLGRVSDLAPDFDAVEKAAFANGGTKSVRLANDIVAHRAAKTRAERLSTLSAILLTNGNPRKFGAYPAKSVADAVPGVREAMDAAAHALVEGLERFNTLRQIEATQPLLVVAQALLERYRHLKRSRGLLDYDDLIARTANLLGRSEARSWVLYKLDLGIDHILLDEAQDTSPRQWSIIDQLVEEFFVGKTARITKRTLFAVGDEKQSIYSFQGARPESFSTQRRKFDELIAGSQEELRKIALNLSFRSTPQVLGAVDAVFKDPAHLEGLTHEIDAYDPHTAWRRANPGQVEVWEKLVGEPSPTPDVWHEHHPALSNPHQSTRLAKVMARRIHDWLDGGEVLHTLDGDRPVHAGDILVLVRARDTFIPALTRALKDLNVPVAGTDRLALTDHIAVKDLIALGRVVLTPQDDLSLAALLKSPLMGLSEDDLFELANRRDGSLFDALSDNARKDPFKRAFEKLSRWMDLVDEMPVYEFFARVLGDDRGRHDFYARLGHESEDVLDSFLALALEREQTGLPGLLGFIENLLMEQPEIKREFSEDQREVRIMTVHAAKGLEAPIVFLVDKSSAALASQLEPSLYEWGQQDAPPDQHGYLWVPIAANHGDVSRAAREKVQQLAKDEYRRLLYVGLTRAKDRLIVCGYRSDRAPPQPNWHDMVTTSLGENLEQSEVLGEPGSGDEVCVHRWGGKADEASSGAKQVATGTGLAGPEAPLPAWVHHRLPQETSLPRPLTPSGAQALIDDTHSEGTPQVSVLLEPEEQPAPIARQRGTVIHRLLQVWPTLDPQTADPKALAYVSASLPLMSKDQQAALVEHLKDVLKSPRLGPYFDPANSRAEVPVMGQIDLASGPRSVSGTIDRMAVFEDRVMLLDYKTSTWVPDTLDEVPQDHLTQMALYRALIARLYPGKSVEAALVWTHAVDAPLIMPLPGAVLDEAFENICRM